MPLSPSCNTQHGQVENANEEMVDITAIFEGAVASLDYSDPLLCNHESFSLQDSMAALELMDPKMDCCEIPATATATTTLANGGAAPCTTTTADFPASSATVGSTTTTTTTTTTTGTFSDPDPSSSSSSSSLTLTWSTIPPRNLPRGLDDALSPLPWDDLTLRDARDVCVEATTRLESMLSGSSVAESTYTLLYAHDCVLRDMSDRIASSLAVATTKTTTTMTTKTTKANAATMVNSSPEAGNATSSSSSSSSSSSLLSPSLSLSPSEEARRRRTVAAQRSVYASSLLLVKLSESARTIVQNADIYEEEDFTVNSHGFRFCPEVDEEGLRVAVDGASRSLDDVLAASASADSGGDGSGGGGGDNAISLREEDRADAQVIGLVIEFQMDLMNACCLMTKLTSKNVTALVTDVKAVVKSALAKLEKLKSILAMPSKCGGGGGGGGKSAIVPESGKRGKVGGVGGNGGKSGLNIVSRCFDSYINRRLLGNAPVRKVKFKSPPDALAALSTIVAELDWAACDLLLHGTTLGRIRRILARVSRSSVNILSRSLIVLNLYFDDLLLGQHYLSHVVAQHMLQISGAPPSLVETEYGRSFLNRLGKPIYDTLKILALNRNRQRAYADALMLREWAALKTEAATVDYYFREEMKLGCRTTPFVTNYVLSTTVWLMEHHLSIGIELGLFPGHHDLSVAFWHWDFLLSTQLNIMIVMKKAKVERKVKEAQIFKEREEKKVAENIGRGKKKGKKGVINNRSANVSAAVSSFMSPTKEDIEDNTEYMLLGLRRTLCRGIVRFIAALNQGKVLQRPTYVFTSHHIIFRKRFESFSVIEQPPPLSYIDFEKGSDYSGVSQDELLSSTAECFKAAKTVIDKLLGQSKDVDDRFSPITKEEIVKLAKVCVSNSISLHRLTEGIKSGKTFKLDVSFDFDVHTQFCSIKFS